MRQPHPEACDESRGKPQCRYIRRRKFDVGYECCVLTVGHKAPHESNGGYTHGEWELNTDAEAYVPDYEEKPMTPNPAATDDRIALAREYYNHRLENTDDLMRTVDLMADYADERTAKLSERVKELEGENARLREAVGNPHWPNTLDPHCGCLFNPAGDVVKWSKRCQLKR